MKPTKGNDQRAYWRRHKALIWALSLLLMGILAIGYAEMNFRQRSVDAALDYLASNQKYFADQGIATDRMLKSYDGNRYLSDIREIIADQERAYERFRASSPYFPMHLRKLISCTENIYKSGSRALNFYLEKTYDHQSEEDYRLIVEASRNWTTSMYGPCGITADQYRESQRKSRALQLRNAESPTPEQPKVANADMQSLPPESRIDFSKPDVPELTKQAESGDVRALTELGIYHLTGLHGNTRNYPEARRLLFKAAENPSLGTMAQSALGSMYEQGTGVEKDLIKAYAWYWVYKMNIARYWEKEDPSKLQKYTQLSGQPADRVSSQLNDVDRILATAEANALWDRLYSTATASSPPLVSPVPQSSPSASAGLPQRTDCPKELLDQRRPLTDTPGIVLSYPQEFRDAFFIATKGGQLGYFSDPFNQPGYIISGDNLRCVTWRNKLWMIDSMFQPHNAPNELYMAYDVAAKTMMGANVYRDEFKSTFGAQQEVVVDFVNDWGAAAQERTSAAQSKK